MDRSLEIVQVGIDHHRAPIDVREKIALGADRIASVVSGVASETWLSELLIVSTCNRTEAYAVSAEEDACSLLVEALRRQVPGAPPEDAGVWVRRTGEDAALHLFRVAAGLDSAILGETEIQGQVNEAHRVALECKAAGAILDRLASLALKAGKRARTDTTLSRGAVSHGQAAYEVARRVFGDLHKRTVLVVGAGEMATLAAKSISALPGGRFVVANRSEEAAQALARSLGDGHVVPLGEVAAQLRDAHVVLFAGGGEPLARSAAEEATARRRDPLLLLDFGVPRCVDPAVGEIPGVFLYDLEAIERMLSKSLASRAEAVPAAEAILAEEFESFLAWHRTRAVVPAIRSLHAWAEEIRVAELKHLPVDLPTSLREQFDRLTHRIVERILRRPTARVRQGVEAGDPGLPTTEHLRSVFGLDDQEPEGATRRGGSKARGGEPERAGSTDAGRRAAAGPSLPSSKPPEGGS